MNVKVLGSGCAACMSMFNDVIRIVDRNHWNIELSMCKTLQGSCLMV